MLVPARLRGWRANPAYRGAAQRVHARVEDTDLGKFPSQAFALN